MTIRHQKQRYYALVATHILGGGLTTGQGETFKNMYRKCRSSLELDQVTKAMHDVLDGWRTGTDLCSRLLQEAYAEPDEDPPALREALVHSQVTFLKQY